MAIIPTNAVIRCRECKTVYGQTIRYQDDPTRLFAEDHTCGVCGGLADVVAVTSGNVVVDYDRTREACNEEDEIRSVLG